MRTAKEMGDFCLNNGYDYSARRKIYDHFAIIECTLEADELKKFKELLDAGIITQEEFDTKKKQLLGL